MNQDPYATLGVARGATEEEISRAYRRLAKIYHPDLNQGNPEAARKMSEINRAYGEIKSGKAAQDGGFSGQAGGGTYGAYSGNGGYDGSPGAADGNPGQEGYGFDPFDFFGFFGRDPGDARGEEGQTPYDEAGRRYYGSGTRQSREPVSFLSGFVRILVGLSVANFFFMFFGRLFF